MAGASRWRRVARAGAGEDYAASYAARFRTLADRGADVHGEAGFVTTLLPPAARILDAGCGTGRVAVRLAELGYDVVGVDVDADMLAQARLAAPHLDWREADLASLRLSRAEDASFDLVLLAGNVVPLLEPGTLGLTVGALGDLLAPGGLLVAGFGLDDAHLPTGCPVTPVADWAAALSAAGFGPVARHAGWDGAPYAGPDAGYLVSVDRSGPA